MWSYNIKCKYMFMFPLKNSARKGLTGKNVLSRWHNENNLTTGNILTGPSCCNCRVLQWRHLSYVASQNAENSPNCSRAYLG